MIRVSWREDERAVWSRLAFVVLQSDIEESREGEG